MRERLFIKLFKKPVIFLLGALMATAIPVYSYMIKGSEVRLDSSGFTGNLSAADNDVQKFAATVDAMVVEGGGAEELDDLSDVAITTPASGHVIIRDATNFKNRALLEADISDFGSYLETINWAEGTEINMTGINWSDFVRQAGYNNSDWDTAFSWGDHGTEGYTTNTGDVTAASAFAVDNVLIRSDGTGKGVQATGISIADTTNNVTGLGTLNTHTIPGGTGTLALTSDLPDLSGLVPYTGATGDVDLGDYDLYLDGLRIKSADDIILLPPTSYTITPAYLPPYPTFSATQIEKEGANLYAYGGTINVSVYSYTDVNDLATYSPHITIPFTDDASDTEFKLQLDWEAVSGATGYALYWYEEYWTWTEVVWFTSTNTHTWEADHEVDYEYASDHTDFETYAIANPTPPPPTGDELVASGGSEEFRLYSYDSYFGDTFYSPTYATFTVDTTGHTGENVSFAHTFSGGTGGVPKKLHDVSRNKYRILSSSPSTVELEAEYSATSIITPTVSSQDALIKNVVDRWQIDDEGFTVGSSFMGDEILNIGGTISSASGKGIVLGAGEIAGNSPIIAIGPFSRAEGQLVIAIGRGAEAGTVGGNQAGSIAVGMNTKALNSFATAIGSNLTASGNSSVAIGSQNCLASGGNSIALGKGQASGFNSIAVGNLPQATANFSMAFGNQVIVSGSTSTGFGGLYTLADDNTLAFGSGAIHFKASKGLIGSYFDASNYFTATVGSTGAVVFDATGAGAKFTFDDPVQVPTLELGHASDTTISRTAAGRINVEGKNVCLEDGTDCPAGGAGDVTAASAFGTDNVLIKADGTGKGVQAAGVILGTMTDGKWCSYASTGTLLSCTQDAPAGSGDVTAVGDCAAGDCFTGSSGTTLTFKGATSGTTTLAPTAIAGTTALTLPAATDTLVGKATTDTLTNKTFNTAGTGNVFQINGTGITAVTGTGSVVLATSPTLVTPALGTPSSGTLTNATGLPLTGLVDDTTTALGVGSVELGHASDTTLARSAAGTVTVEGTLLSRFSRTTEASSATPTPTGGFEINHYSLTALATAPTFAAPSGTPAEGNRLTIRVHDNGTARALAYNAIYVASTEAALPTTTVLGKALLLGFIYDSTDSVWRLVAVANQP